MLPKELEGMDFAKVGRFWAPPRWYPLFMAALMTRSLRRVRLGSSEGVVTVLLEEVVAEEACEF
jgi:hypothetical protein